jgi:hypothetical protein
MNKRGSYISNCFLLGQLLVVPLYNFAQADSTGSRIKQEIVFSVGINQPTPSLPFSSIIDKTYGVGYKNRGSTISLSHNLLVNNQGIINTVFYSINNFDNSSFSSDNTVDVTPSIASGGQWKTFGLLTGYYRNFIFRKKEFISLDMKIQAGFIYGNYPSTQRHYDYSPYQWQDLSNKESWSTGMVGLTGMGLNYKPFEKYAFRFGMEYIIGRIDHVVETLNQNYQYPPSPHLYTTEKNVSINPTQYWSLEITLGVKIKLQ